jgi:hypothetical protein
MSEANNISIEEENINFNDMVKTFIAEQTPSVHILTPCYGGQCHVNYMICLMNTHALFQAYGIDIQFHFMQNDSLVPRARNNLVAKAMANPTMTHIMFIDNDITWDPIDVIKLLLAQKPIIGGIYPLKNYNWSKLLPKDESHNPINEMINKKNTSPFANSIPESSFIQNKLLKYNVNYLSENITISKNLTPVRHLATGFMMIRRDVIDKMFLSYPQLKYTDDVNALVNETEQSNAYALFDCEVINNHYYSEDWLFCHRWTELKGDIWIDISIALTHTGTEHYRGNFMASLM